MEIEIVKSLFKDNQELNELFQNCPVDILKHCEIKEYQPGAIIYRQGEKCDRLSIIVEGYVDIYATAENGGKYSPRVSEKGDFIGEMELFEEKPLLNFVESITKLKLLQIKREYFLKWLEIDKNISMYIIKYSNNRSCKCAQKTMENSLYSLKTRVCNYLISCSKQVNNKDSYIEIKLDKEKLSERFAVTARSINRILQHLKKENIIEVNANKMIIIKDWDKLVLEEKRSRLM